MEFDTLGLPSEGRLWLDTSLAKKVMLVAGAFIGLSSGFAVLYFGTLSIFLKPIANEFGWGRGETSYIVSGALLGSALGVPIIGIIIDRFGPVRPILASVLGLAAALYVFSLFPNNRPLFATLSFLFGATTVGTGAGAYLAGLQHAFDRRLGLALGVAMAGLGLGSMLAPSIAQLWVEHSGWRSAYRSLALLALCAGLLATLLIALGQPERGRGVTGSANVRVGLGVGEAVGDWRLWALSLAIFLGTCAGLGTVVHMVPLLTDRGMSSTDAAQILGALGFGLAIGRVCSGFLMDILFAPLIGVAGFVSGIIGLLVFASQISNAFIVLAPAAVLIGLSMGVEGDFAAFAVRRYFGSRSFGSIYGIVYAFFCLGGVIGPTVYGVMFDALGGYRFGLIAAMVAFLSAAILILLLGHYRFTSEAMGNAKPET